MDLIGGCHQWDGMLVLLEEDGCRSDCACKDDV